MNITKFFGAKDLGSQVGEGPSKSSGQYIIGFQDQVDQ